MHEIYIYICRNIQYTIISILIKVFIFRDHHISDSKLFVKSKVFKHIVICRMV